MLETELNKVDMLYVHETVTTDKPNLAALGGKKIDQHMTR